MNKFVKFGEFLNNKKPKTAGALDNMKKDGLVGDVEEEKPDDHIAQEYEGEIDTYVYKADNDDSESLNDKKGSRVKPEDSSLGSKPESKVKILPKKKLTAEAFVYQTEKMTDGEFVNFMLSESVTTDTTIPTITDLYGNEFTPDPNQTIAYLAGLMLANENMVCRFIREVKRRDGLDKLMKEVFDHPEAYDIAVEAMRHPEKGVNICDRLSRSMNDQYMSDMQKYLEESYEVGEDVMPNMHKREKWNDKEKKNPPQQQGGNQQQQPPQGGQPGGGGGGGEEQPPGGEPTGNPAGGGGSNPGPGEWDTPPDPNYSGEGNPPSHDIKGGGNAQPQQQQPDFGKGPLKKPKMMKEYAGDYAFKQLGESMVKYEDIRNYLEDRCVNCKNK